MGVMKGWEWGDSAGAGLGVRAGGPGGRKDRASAGVVVVLGAMRRGV